MRTRIQIALLIGAVLFLAWALALIVNPAASQNLISTQSLDTGTTRLLGASFLGWAVACAIAAREPGRTLIWALAAAMLIIGLMALWQMAVSGTMPVQATNVTSLVVDLGVAGFLWLYEIRLGGARPRRRRPAKKAVKKKTAKGRARPGAGKKTAGGPKKKAAKKKKAMRRKKAR